MSRDWVRRTFLFCVATRSSIMSSKEGFPPLYSHIKCNMSELVRILQVSNECKCCLVSRWSDVTSRFRSLPQISAQALMASCIAARLLCPALLKLNYTKLQCCAADGFCESNGVVQGLQVCEYSTLSRLYLIQIRYCVFI